MAVKEITDRLPDRDFVCFTCRFDSNWSGEEKIGNVRVIRLGSGGKNYYRQFFQKFFYIFRAWRAAEKVHKITPINVVWAMMASYGGFAALLFKLRHPKVPLFLTLQEGDSESHILRRVNVFYPIWRLIFKKADYVQTISHYLADFARRHGAKCPIEVIPNGVDLKKYNSMLGRSNLQKLDIITTSRLVYKNGIDILVRAMAVVASEAKKSSEDRRGLWLGDDVKLRILGSGPDEQKLKNLAAELGIADSVEFLGHIEPDKIPEYLARADIFVRPSRSEGLGSSFLEAMAAGLPIIGTSVGGIPDFLIDLNLRTSQDLKNYDPKNPSAYSNDPNGIFTETDNPKDLAEKILLLLKNDELRKKLGENGRKLVAEKYNWDNIAVKINKIFSKL